MQWDDAVLFGKKILVGLVLAAVPVLILLGSLQLVQRVFAAAR